MRPTDHGSVGLGKPYGIVALEIILQRRAWSHAYRLSMGSLCTLSHGSQNARPYGFSKVNVQMSYGPMQMQFGFWNTRMQHQSKLHMRDLCGLRSIIRDKKGVCKIILKTKSGPNTCKSVCDPCDCLWSSTGQNGRKRMCEKCAC